MIIYVNVCVRVCMYVCMYVCRFKHMASEATRASPRPDVLGTLAFAPTGAFPPPFLSDAKIAWSFPGDKGDPRGMVSAIQVQDRAPVQACVQLPNRKVAKKITTEFMVDMTYDFT